MRTEELMRGDLLFYKGKLNAFPFKVEQITKKKIGYHAEPNENRMHYLYPSEVVPIPLTKEILERNGFGYCESDAVLNHFYLGEPHFCKNMSLHIGHSIDKDVYWLNYHDNSIYGIMYVHQLQHALRICGLNMEVQL